MQIKTKKSEFKEVYFYIFVILIAIILLLKTNHQPNKQTIAVKVFQQTEQLQNVFAKKNTQPTTQFSVDTIYFPEGNVLYHGNTGSLAFKKNFFLSLQTQINLNKDTHFNFIIESDDGFQLKINNQVVCEFTHARAMQATICENISLKQGLHHLNLDYYQGYGRMGLIAKYRVCNLQICDKEDYAKKALEIGIDSPFINFQPINSHNG